MSVLPTDLVAISHINAAFLVLFDQLAKSILDEHYLLLTGGKMIFLVLSATIYRCPHPFYTLKY